MKEERFKQWSKLSYSSPKSHLSPKPIVMRELPNFQETENDLLLDIMTYKNVRALTFSKIQNLSKQLFGIDESDTTYKWSKKFGDWPEGSPKHLQALNSHERHEAQFETTNLSDEETAKILKDSGYDFFDERGHPMRLTSHFKRQVEAVVKKIAGHPPDIDEAKLQTWGSRLLSDSQEYVARKRRENLQ